MRLKIFLIIWGLPDFHPRICLHIALVHTHACTHMYAHTHTRHTWDNVHSIPWLSGAFSLFPAFFWCLPPLVRLQCWWVTAPPMGIKGRKDDDVGIIMVEAAQRPPYPFAFSSSNKIPQNPAPSTVQVYCSVLLGCVILVSFAAYIFLGGNYWSFNLEDWWSGGGGGDVIADLGFPSLDL